MTISEFLYRAKNQLSSVSETPDLDAEILLAFVIKKERTFLFSRPEYLLSSEQKNEGGRLLQQRILGKPIAQILGKSEFYGLEFLVNEHTLIPRPETEILVENALPYLQNDEILIDVGTGSGCIPISLGKKANIQKIIAIEKSNTALEMAKKNAEKHQVEVNFICNDFMSELRIKNSELRKKMREVSDVPKIITANLPYVPNELRHPSTKCEPDTAIFSGKDGLDHYRDFFMTLAKFYFDFDVCLFEFHSPQKEFFESTLPQAFSNYSLAFVSDLSGKPRLGILKKILDLSHPTKCKRENEGFCKQKKV